ncbi:aflatoxin efflux pump [Nannizzia gypsea CBS 118893]|uniref:Aflatoxin efflux pump n=1 Tax=Arthroderma gypseum (strain ATCC MYA-4604 / CBS 118893) TaxID=535722 RepID=E4V417_ARTGP|nr:aflatoxin efflux pump [Nannizzia gypsea CBS 118893]EFR04741.1 aflatoxin efflux pump [Nannizzia gypsea CBS 118893]
MTSSRAPDLGNSRHISDGLFIDDISRRDARDGPEKENSDTGEFLRLEEERPSENEFRTTGLRLFLILSSLLVSVFCQALDDTIIATAIPPITDHFRRLSHVGWYGSVYLLTNCAFQLFYGKLYKIFPLRWVFMSALFIFELGSLVAAIAPKSETLITGRAIAGIGAAGITSGAMTIMAHTAPVRWRPTFTSMIGAVYGVSSAVGPLLGGVLAEKASWRWIFYLNLPLGGAAALILSLSLKRLPTSAGGQNLSVSIMVKRLDVVGTFAFIASIACLLTALQYGGTTTPWSSGLVIALLTMFSVLLTTFIVAQILQKDENATIPTHIAKNRNMAFGALFAICQGGAFNIFIFYLPLYFQVIKDTNPIKSGVNYLPLILVNTIGIIISGLLTTKLGYYMPWIWFSSMTMPIGAGLLTTLAVDSNTSQWVGYQLIFAIGSGFGLQQPFVTAQTSLPLEEVSTGMAIMLFSQLGGGAIFVPVAQSVFISQLVTSVGKAGILGLDSQQLVSLGATQFRQIVSPKDIPRVVLAYNSGLQQAFNVALILACMSIIGPLGMKWVSLKPQIQKGSLATVEQDKV